MHSAAFDLQSKDRMSVKERMPALVAGESIDRVPFVPSASGFAARIYGIDRGTLYRDPDIAFAAGQHLMKTFPWMNARPLYGWADRGSWEFGGRILWPDNNRYAAPCSVSLITEPADVDRLPDPDPATAGMIPLVDRFNILSRQRGFPASLPGGTPTTLSAGIVGRSRFLKWLIRYPEAVHKLQRKVTDFIIRTAERTLKKHGPENCSLFCGVPMESNQLISPATFVEFAKPYIHEILSFYKTAGVRSMVLHLCGEHTRNLEHFLELPLSARTVFSIGDEMDLIKTSKAIGDSFILAGNISTRLLHGGSFEAVLAETRTCLRRGMTHKGGFILMPACELPPDTPMGNIHAVARALFEEGYY